MVKFGERLPQLMHKGWAQYYLDYDALKKLIETSGTVDARASEAFFALLKKEILKVDDFVQKESARIQTEKDKAMKASGAGLSKVRKELATLRNFVGTNIIAATKIVKKHDKNAAKELQRGHEVSALVCGGPGMTNVLSLHAEIDKASGIKSSNSAPKDVSITIDKDDDESEEELRSLPQWLLTKYTTREVHTQFYNVYLREWKASGDLSEPMLAGPRDSGSDTSEGAAWDVDFSSDVKKWGELTGGEKVLALLGVAVKISIILLSLYAFICSLSFLASGFRLVAGRQAGQIFRNSEIFNNPIAGVLVGVLVTVLVQSSSTSTSIVITMVAADLLTARQAIALIMGANIGTSVTSTIVALAQSSDPAEFRRAFAAATVHDMFNFLSVLILLPVEAATGFLYHVSKAIIDASPGLSSAEKPPDILKVITKPFTKLIMSIDKKVITKIATAETQADLDALEGARILKFFFGWGPEDMSDGAAGAIVLIFALAILCTTLFLIVYTLKSLLKGRVAVWLHRSVNGNVPDLKCGGLTIPLGWLSGYLAMGTGVLVTICVQSSSITTSALTPLVGVGVISVDRMYPTVLGANIGTCVTGVLAALAADASKLALTLQVAYSHLLFNITGITIWYVIWPLRAVPINAAKFLGNTTAKYRWFALAYLFFCFFLIPAIFFALSIGSSAACVAVAVIIALVAVFVGVVNKLQAKNSTMLPAILRDWTFLPLWMRSLEPFDRVVCARVAPLCACCVKRVAKKPTESTTKKISKAIEGDLEVAATRLGSGSSSASATQHM